LYNEIKQGSKHLALKGPREIAQGIALSFLPVIPAKAGIQ
jgi:hypothetical protein